MAKRFTIRGIRKNRAYAVDELADVANVSQQTVRNWLRSGLQPIDQARPTLILGCHVLDFLGKRQAKAKRPLARDEFYCLRCKAPRKPLGMMADFELEARSGPRLMALCGACGCACYRNISIAQLPEFSRVLEIATKAGNRACASQSNHP